MPFKTTDEELAQWFRHFGTVTSGEVITDRYTGRSRGFGLVEMPKDDEADLAITALNGHSEGGRRLVVNEARPRAEPLRPNLGRAGRVGGQGRDGRGHRKGGDRDAGRGRRGDD